jgi:anion-transporting  ArsA/GET3 family ATPase
MSDPGHYDLIIVDAPASGQALSLLKMPTAAHSTFGDSMVGKEAKNISALLRDPERCALVQVSTADSLSVSETIETYTELKNLEMKPSIVMFNRAIPLSFDAEDITTLLSRRSNARNKHSHLAELAEYQLNGARESRKAVTHIRRTTHSPLIEVPEHSGVDGLELIERLTADLAAIDSADVAVRAERAHSSNH